MGTSLRILVLGLLVVTTLRPSPVWAADCTKTSVGLIPLMDMGAGDYRGEEGGLYPGGTNQPPPEHAAAGRSFADSIVPRDPTGRPDASGRQVLLSIGMSNTTQEFAVFKAMADADPDKDPALVVVDGAQGGVTASRWANEGDGAWANVDKRLSAAGVTPAQVSVVWMKVANARPTNGFPAETERLERDMEAIVQILKGRFANLVLTYNSSRIYAGYASSTLNPEPYAYESGFAVKWLIRRQLDGAPELNHDPSRGLVKAPWLGWGPYLWADGMSARSDGLVWECRDLGSDGTHPSESGRRKVAQLLLDFFKSDPIAARWFTLGAVVSDPAGDANGLNGQGLVAGRERGPDTRPASLDRADLTRLDFETALERVSSDEGDRVEPRALRIRFSTLGLPGSPASTTAFRVALDLAGCGSVIEAFVRGPASTALDPADGLVRWQRSGASCPDGSSVATHPDWTTSIAPATGELIIDLPFASFTPAERTLLGPGALLRTPSGATVAVTGSFAHAWIDETERGRDFVVGSDLPAAG